VGTVLTPADFWVSAIKALAEDENRNIVAIIIEKIVATLTFIVLLIFELLIFVNKNFSKNYSPFLLVLCCYMKCSIIAIMYIMITNKVFFLKWKSEFYG